MPRVVSFIVLLGILLFIAAMFFRVMAQFVLPLFLAAVLVVVFKPLHVWVLDRLPGRVRVSALVTTILIMLVVLLPTAWLGWNAYLEGRGVFHYLSNPANQADLVRKLQSAAEPVLRIYDSLSGIPAELPAPPTADEGAAPATTIDGPQDPLLETPEDAAPFLSPDVSKPGVDLSRTPLDARAIFSSAASLLGALLRTSVQILFRLILGLIIMVLALYYFLVDGPAMIHTMMRLSPLDNQYEQELLDRFANVSRGVVVAVLASAAVQGLLAGIGFYLALPAAAPIFLLTMVTMITAVIPFVGAAGIWIPTCLWIYLYQERVAEGVVTEGDPWRALALAAYCAGIVSTIDNVIKPLILHGQSNLHPLLALMSVLGGVTALGPVGILVGPMLVAFVHALLVMVNRELQLLSLGETIEPGRGKSSDVHPATQLQAEGVAGRSGGFLAKVAALGSPRGAGEPGPAAPDAGQPAPSRRRRRRK